MNIGFKRRIGSCLLNEVKYVQNILDVARFVQIETEASSEVSATFRRLSGVLPNCVNIISIRDRPFRLSLCVFLKFLASGEDRTEPDENISGQV